MPELALRGWPAVLTTAGTTRTDLLAQVGERHLPAAIQVKTKSPQSTEFQLGGLDAGAVLANEWVVLVGLRPNASHRFFVVPRDVVAATVKALNLAYDDPSRVIIHMREYTGYEGEDAWELLKRPSWEAPWRIRQWVYDYRGEMTWPDGHPGIPDDHEIEILP